MARFTRIVPLFVLVVIAGSLLPSSSAGATTHHAPATIDATGARDVTSELQSFLDSVPNGASIEFPPLAQYRIEGTLYLFDRSALTIDGNGAVFFATTDGSSVSPPSYSPALAWSWPRKRVHWYVDRSTSITFREMDVRGANPNGGPTNDAFVPSLEAQHGFEFFASKDVRLEDCHVSDTYGDLVSVTGGSQSVVVSGCTLERSGRQGVTVDRGSQVLVLGNTIRQIGRSAIDLEPARDTWVVHDVRIEGNVIGKANGVAVAAYGAGSHVSNVAILNNRLVGEPLVVLVKAPYGHRRREFSVVGNRSDTGYGSPQAPLRFTRVDGVEVRNNYQSVSPNQSRLAVWVRESCDVVVEGNEFPNAIEPIPDTDNWAGCEGSPDTTVPGGDGNTSGGTAGPTAPEDPTAPTPDPESPDSTSPDDGNGNGGTGSELPSGEEIVRLSGADRIGTSIAVSEQTWAAGAARTAVLARHDDFADALAGAPLAARREGPLLLTPGTALDPRVRSEIERAVPRGATLSVLGGSASVDPAVDEELRSLGYAVERFAGVDRYDTALRIVRDGLGDPTSLLLTTGDNFPDALAAGTAGGLIDGGVLLTAGTSLPAAVGAYLRARPDASVYAIGGPAAAAYRAAAPIVGADRFETAVRVAQQFFPSTSAVGIASGSTFADALAAAPHLAKNRGPLLLASQDELPTVVADHLSANATSTSAVFVYGGPAALSDEVVRQVAAVLV